MNTLAMTDADLLARYAGQRDSEAFAELVRRHAAMVYATCRRVCGAGHADDAAQEAFLALAHHAARIRDSVPGWLHVVATRKAARFIRAGATAVPLTAAEGAPAPDPELQRLQTAVDSALAGLPDRLRAPLVLHFLEGRTQTEIAAVLGLSQPTVQRRLQEGLGALRTALAHGGPAALAVALAGLPRPGVPAEVIAGCGRVALAAPVATSAGSSMALLGAGLLISAGLLVWLLRPSGPPLTAVAVEPPTAAVEPAPPVVDPPAVADPLAIPWSIEGQLDPGFLAWVIEQALGRAGTPTRVVWGGADDALRVDLGSAPTLRASLDDLARTHGLRWSWRPGCLLIDRPLAEPQRSIRLSALAAARTAEDAVAPAREIAASGDLAAIHDLLVIAADAPHPAGDAMVHAYAETWMSSYGHHQLPLPLDQQLVDAIAKRWRQLTPERLRIIDVVLVGQAGVQEARPRLHALLAGTERGLPPATRPILRDASDQYRISAALALAWLSDGTVQKPILDWTTSDPRTRILPPLYSALGQLGTPLDPTPLLTHHALPDYEYSVFAGLYTALTRAGPPDSAATFLARRRAAMGDKAGVECFLGPFCNRPSPAFAPALIDAFATATKWPEAERWNWVPTHAASFLPPDVIVPALSAALPRAADPARRDSLMAGLASADDASAVAAIIADGGGGLAARKRLATLAFSRADARSALLARLATGDVVAGEAAFLPAHHEVLARLGDAMERSSPAVRREVRHMLASASAPGPWAELRARHLASADPSERIELARLVPADEARSWYAAAEGIELRSAILARLLASGGDNAAFALDQLEGSRDAALQAALAPAIDAEAGPPSSWGRRATLLQKWMEAEDRELRLAAVRAVGDHWVRMICPWSPVLVRGLHARCKDESGAVAESAHHALDKWRSWTGSGVGWAAASWIIAVRGQFDDARVLEELEGLLTVRPRLDQPEPALPPAQDF